MTGFRTDKKRVEWFKAGERVCTASGRRGKAIKVRGDGSVLVAWDDGEEFSLMPVHLMHEERFFGGEDSTRPGGS